MNMAKHRSISLGIVSSLVLALLMTFMAPVGTMAALPDNEVNLGANGFVLSGAYSASAPGSFQPSTVVGPYQEGTCVPVVVQATNVGAAAGDMDFRISYRFQGGAIDSLEVMLGGPSDPMTATQLNDFSYPGSDLTAATMFSSSLGNNITATITGPFSENVVGADPILPGDLDRHYNVTLQNVQPIETVNILACARLNANASQYSGTMVVSTSDSAIASEGGAVPIQANLLTSAPATGSLTLNKVVVNDNGGTYDVSNFPLFLVNWDTSSTVSVTSGDTLDLAPGLYRYYEVSSSLYQGLYSGDCWEHNNIVPGGPFPENERGFVVINSGDVKSCTLTNDDYEFAGAVVLVKKLVVNDDGGTNVPEDFLLSVSSSAGLQTFNGTSTSPLGDLYAGTKIFIPANQPYEVLEPSHPGYFPSFSAGCSGTLPFGEGANCTVTNDDTTLGRITLNKVVVNDDGGIFDVPNFPLTLVNWDTSTTIPVVSGQTLDVEPGLYRFLEISSPYYHALYSGDCNEYNNLVPGGPFPENGRGFFTLAAGDIKSCTLTNDDYPLAGASVLVKKLVVNDDGGTKQPGDFQLSVSSTGVFQMFNGTSTNPDGGDVYAGTQVFIPINEPFVVNEVADTGYVATFQGDCSGTASFAELKLCTVTNDDAPTGTLTVIKTVVNDDGGTAVAGDFTLLFNDENAEGVTIFQGDASGTVFTIGAGSTYNVTENPPSNYQASFSNDCGGVMQGGSNVVCIVTNDDVESTSTSRGATLIVRKVVINDNGGGKVPSEFMISVTGTNPSITNFLGDASGTVVTLEPGAYVVNEVDPANYLKSLGVDCAGTIAAGETKVCIITNDDQIPGGGGNTVPGGGGGSSGGGSTIPGGSSGGGSSGGGSSIPGQVLGETSEDPSEDPAEDPGTPTTGTNNPGTPAQLPRTGLPAGLALAALLPLGLYARRRS
jgi:uncharacterized membrane protein YgcG